MFFNVKEIEWAISLGGCDLDASHAARSNAEMGLRDRWSSAVLK